MKGWIIASGTALALSCATALAVAATQAGSAAKATETRILSARGLDPRAGEASPEGRLLIGRGRDYVPIPGDPAQLANALQGSMAQRRQAAWRIVEAALEPQPLTHNGVTYEVPLWQTWYEGLGQNPDNAEIRHRIEMFIARLAACGSTCPSREQIAREVLTAAPNKNLVRSLTPANLEQVLPQFRDPALNPEGPIGHGTTLFSPSFLEHVLTQAEGIERCTGRDPPDAPPPAPDQFSHCIREFPRSAVMIKARWEAIPRVGARANAPDTSEAAMRRIIRNGTWPRPPQLSRAPVDPSTIYTVEATNEQRYALTALHISTKDVREWTWISLWWSPDPNGDFGQDRPASIARYNGGVWSHYKMCVTTAFEEGDAAPWQSFAAQPQLAAALRATHEELARQAEAPPFDRITTWCSNPNVETQIGNARTNCVGCHQYSRTWNPLADGLAEGLDPITPGFATLYPQFGRSRRRTNFPADFAWAFSRQFGDEIRDAMERHRFRWPERR